MVRFVVSLVQEMSGLIYIYYYYVHCLLYDLGVSHLHYIVFVICLAYSMARRIFSFYTLYASSLVQ